MRRVEPGFERVLLFLLLMLLIVNIPHISRAAGPVHGAKGAALATAFVATADDPSAMAYNPAGLTQIKGMNIYSGMTILFPSTTYRDPSGLEEKTQFQAFFPPHLYFTTDLGREHWVFGMGIFSPFGIGGRKWSDAGLTRFVSTRADIVTIAANPTVAWRPLPYLSVGAGVNYMFVYSRRENRVDQSMAGGGEGSFRLEGDGDGWGYNLGLILRLTETIRFGIAFRSGITVDIDGTATLEDIAPSLQPLFGGASFETDADTTIDFPEILSIGIAFHPSEKVTLEVDGEWGGWSSFDTQTVDLKTEVPGAGFTDNTVVLGWKDVWSLRAGIEYRLSDRIALRGGYAFLETYVPERTLESGNPDADQHNFTVGFGYVTGKFTIDSFFQMGIYEDRGVDNAILSGEYENSVYYVGMSTGYRF